MKKEILLKIKNFIISKTPLTNKDYSDFLISIREFVAIDLNCDAVRNVKIKKLKFSKMEIENLVKSLAQQRKNFEEKIENDGQLSELDCIFYGKLIKKIDEKIEYYKSIKNAHSIYYPNLNEVHFPKNPNDYERESLMCFAFHEFMHVYQENNIKYKAFLDKKRMQQKREWEMLKSIPVKFDKSIWLADLAENDADRYAFAAIKSLNKELEKFLSKKQFKLFNEKSIQILDKLCWAIQLHTNAANLKKTILKINGTNKPTNTN